MDISVKPDIRSIAKKSIDRADDTIVKMILAILVVKEKENIADTDFDTEIERRFLEYEQGNIEPITLDELETRDRESPILRLKSINNTPY